MESVKEHVALVSVVALDGRLHHLHRQQVDHVPVVAVVSRAYDPAWEYEEPHWLAVRPWPSDE